MRHTTLAILLLLCLAALSPEALAYDARARVQSAIDLLKPIDPQARHDPDTKREFEAAKAFVEADMDRLFDEFEREQPTREGIKVTAARLSQSLALLGETGGYTAPQLQHANNSWSLRTYRELDEVTHTLCDC